MIEEFRTIWHGCQAHSEAGFGRGASARIAQWSLERAEAVLKYAARSSICIAAPDSKTATPHERSLEAVAQNLAHGDREQARLHAQWLVRPHAVEQLLRALDPIATGPAKLIRAA